MDQYTATEQAYKNGYEQGQKDAADRIFAWFRLKSIILEIDLREFAEQYGIKIADGKQRGSNERV